MGVFGRGRPGWGVIGRRVGRNWARGGVHWCGGEEGGRYLYSGILDWWSGGGGGGRGGRYRCLVDSLLNPPANV